MMDLEKSIGQLLDEEINNASLTLFKNDSEESFSENQKFADEVIEEILKRLEGKLDGFLIFVGLRMLLIKLQLEHHWIEEIYSTIKLRLSVREDCHDFPRNRFLSSLEMVRVGHHRRVFESELTELDLAQQLSAINRTLNNNYLDDDGVRKKALLEIRKKIEEEIIIETKELEIRNALKDTKVLDKLEDGKSNNELTLDRAILLMDYIFQYCNVTSIKKDRADVISFLTKYSSETVRQRLSSIYSQKKKNIESYKKDLRIVRKFFHKLGLTELTKEIDTHL